MEGKKGIALAVTGKRVVRKMLRTATAVLLALSLGIYSLGCGGDFLGLEDYQRDLLFGAIP